MKRFIFFEVTPGFELDYVQCYSWRSDVKAPRIFTSGGFIIS